MSCRDRKNEELGFYVISDSPQFVLRPQSLKELAKAASSMQAAHSAPEVGVSYVTLQFASVTSQGPLLIDIEGNSI